ncbi:MAG TPA: hypothetical protein VLA37_07085, partial [Sphingomonadaceae bacterium]|nr:hypothetical protein [Sphingomonadaceae bacterium]
QDEPVKPDNPARKGRADRQGKSGKRPDAQADRPAKQQRDTKPKAASKRQEHKPSAAEDSAEQGWNGPVPGFLATPVADA